MTTDKPRPPAQPPYPPGVTHTGSLFDMDGLGVHVGTDYDTVTIRLGGVSCRLDATHQEVFAQFFVAACHRSGFEWGKEAAGSERLAGEGRLKA